MRILYWTAGILLGVVLVTIAVLAIAVGYTAACPDAASSPPGADVMRAVKYQCYGSPEVLQVVATARPEPAADEVLVRVRAASVNPMDWHYMRGSPYFMRLMSGIGRPADTRLGTDFAGVVESVGAEVSEFKPGDPVFGGAAGAFGEFVVRDADRSIAHMPPGISFAEAAAIPVAAITALQALRDSGKVQAGQRVLINGASGGVGGYAVQIARSMGATVTGVCSARNVERVLALGADRVIDYTLSDYTRGREEYDLIVDLVGNHSVRANRRVLASEGRMVMVAGGQGDWLGPLQNPIMAALLAPFVDQEFVTLLARLEKPDLETLAAMMAGGELRTVIDRHYPLSEVAEAIAYSETGRAQGKIILDID